MRACSIRVQGIVQGVGFRPFVYRLATKHSLNGWVLNGEQGVEIFAEGLAKSLADFISDLKTEVPPAAKIAKLEINDVEPQNLEAFTIRESERRDRPTVRISPDLPLCDDCLTELFDAADPRYQYPYINCTNCGPRYSVILELPYDRPNTTMKSWPLDELCGGQYGDPANRRFHAQPVACARCGPGYYLRYGDVEDHSPEVVATAARLLSEGKIVAVKGLGGYHLACDARNPSAVRALRERKFRKERPFALMVKDLSVARQVVDLNNESEELLTSVARPIVLAPAKADLPEVAPGNNELGVMLPYTPLHHLLFAADSPDILVMTSANRSSEPIAYEEEDALHSLAEIADAFLVGERPIARRVDDSVARAGTFGPMILRRARGYAPAAVTTFPTTKPILAVGADLKNAITLVVGGQAFVSQHIGDLDHYSSFRAFDETIRDLLKMYEIRIEEVTLVHDLHPQYRSTVHALGLPVRQRIAVQHHRAHVASVLAEKQAWETQVVGASFDGTGYGDDGGIWGGEVFIGSLHSGLRRVAHLRPASLPGGDAAAQNPVQAAAGFLSQLDALPDLSSAPFRFSKRYSAALELVQKQVRTFSTTSVGRLFDTAAALLGFDREITFEGQAAIWLEQLAGRGSSRASYSFPFENGELDFRPLLRAVIDARLTGTPPADIARSFQRGFAQGVAKCVSEVSTKEKIVAVVLSGGVFQNELLLADLQPMLAEAALEVWVNRAVPPNDGGISLGQAAIGSLSHSGSEQ